jgi:hypothetical protein
MMNDERKTPAAPGLSFILHYALFILIGLTFVVVLAWSWYDWPDPIVDFGRELYVPWKLTQGQVLYRDIAYFNGPLSPYFNSIVMRVLGVSLRSIVLVNLILLAGLVAMIWWLWSIVANRLAATTACIVLLAVFSFIQLGGIGNYNFVTPYSHEITHGVILSFAAMCCVAAYLRRQRVWWLACCGLALGIVFLTKPEVFVAAAVGVGAGVALATRFKPTRLAAFALPILVAPVIAFCLLCLEMPSREAFDGVIGEWHYLADPHITGMAYYRKVLGTDQLGANLLVSVATAIVYALWLALAALPALSLKRPDARLSVMLFIGWTIVALVLFGTVDLNVWQKSLRGLSLVVPALAIGMFILSVRRANDPAGVLRAMVCLFAAALLGKIFFHVTSFHYGFALAMPATLVGVAAMLDWLPKRFPAGQHLVPPAILPGVGLFILVHLYIFGARYAHKGTLVSSGADAFRADPVAMMNDTRGRSVNLMLERLRELPPNATLACVPEGVMINYLSRRTNSTPYINLMPPEVLMFGQERIVQAFEQHPPDYLVLVIRSDPVEYGYKSFKDDYGRDIFQWMQRHYEPVPAPTTATYPLLLWKRKP